MHFIILLANPLSRNHPNETIVMLTISDVPFESWGY